jgi:hypothetical protein
MQEDMDLIAQAYPPPGSGCLRAFGLSLSADLPLPGAWEASPPTEPIMRLQSATPQAIAESWSGLETVGWEGSIDGAPFVVERGRAGDHRFVHEGRSVHHLSADTAVLLCGPDVDGEPLRWRVILDSVLFSAALIRGYEALHAGAVATDNGALAITAGTGGGKSTLLVELLRGGCSMLCDDVVVIEPRGEAPPLAVEAPPLAGEAPLAGGLAGEAPPLAHPGAPLMTVPAQIAPAPGAAIASVGEERWVAVPAHPQAIPLMAVVALNRSPGLATSLHRVRNPLPALLGSLLRFPRTPQRERARFEVAGTIALHVPIWELTADPSVAPDTLAGLLRAELIEPQKARTQSRSAAV